MVEVAAERPPYVTFEVRAIEDRNASIEQGHYVAKDVDFALITPAGSKDRIERVVAEWFAKLEEDVRSQRVDPAWPAAFKEAYKAWKDGREIPVNGTPILTWPSLSPAQVKTLIDCQLRTIEDLAVVNEDTLARIGMGGRALKQRAIDWLASAASIGKPSEELSKLKTENSDLKQQNTDLLAKVKGLEAKVQVLSTPSKG
jgi:hypothetical protein